MQHWKLTLSYDGSHFHGWQVQPGLRTVQGALASVIHHLFGEEVLPQGSGRTDAGVHALAQVVSFSLKAAIPPPNLIHAMNQALPQSVRVLSETHVNQSFHARRSAQAKTYEYRVFQRRRVLPGAANPLEFPCSPFLAPFVWDCPWALSVERMQAAASLVCGTHDFSSFAASDPDLKSRSDKAGAAKMNPRKKIWQSAWSTEGDLLIYQVRGSGFLHHMVRNLVGTFVDVGRGSLEPEDITKILDARQRSAAGPTAPARGLFLRSVEYGLGFDAHE